MCDPDRLIPFDLVQEVLLLELWLGVLNLDGQRVGLHGMGLAKGL